MPQLPNFLRLGTASTAVGVSIGSSSVKIVELKNDRKSWTLLHFGIVQLPDESIVNREVINSIAIIDALKTVLNQMKLGTKQVTLSLSGTFLIIKRLTIDIPNLKELQDQVFWEAEQYLPFDVSEVVMDYHLISYNKDKKADVLLVAIKKSVLESYMTLLQDVGLKPKTVDVDYFALQNVLELNYPQNPSEAVAVVDLGANAMKTVIVQAGIPVFTKESSLGGRSVTAEIQKHLNLNFNDAETMKVSAQGGALPQEVNELIHVACENYATEIKRTLDFYTASSSGAPVAYILLTGGGAKIGHLSKMVEDTCLLPTQVLNPFNAINYDAKVFTPEYLSAIGPLAAVAVGNALRAGEK